MDAPNGIVNRPAILAGRTAKILNRLMDDQVKPPLARTLRMSGAQNRPSRWQRHDTQP